ncbi:phosphatase PAP2 family protein [Patescibacteria group bacterium]|nr:phosphatase PAP2 family protein [Patescibacteria group bacterium]
MKLAIKLIKNKLATGLLSIAFLYIVLLLTGVLKSFVNLEIISNIDEIIGSIVNSFQTIMGLKIFSLITFLGEIYLVIVFAIILSVILWMKNKKWQISVLWLTLIGSEVFTYVTKLIVNRPRPEYAVFLEHSGSFPSNHATVAMAFYGFLIYLLLQYLKNKRERFLIATLGIIIILTIGFSRLYLGVHYFSDVLTGYLVGLLWLCIGINLTKKIITKQK